MENVFVFIEILFKMLLFKGGVLYAEYVCVCVCVCEHVYVVYEDTNLYNDMGMT